MLELDKVHNVDCFIAATQLDDQSVDAVITDPPYPNRNQQFEDTITDGYAMLYLACKKAKNYVIFFWNPFNVPPPPPGWHEVARAVWHKPDCKSIIHYEVIVAWAREERMKVSRVWSIPILDYRSLRDWKPHPTQKPVRLLRYVLEQFTKEGDIVFDPFVGSGTTAVACQQMNRRFIACEKNPEYAQIATTRVAERTKKEELPTLPADEEAPAPDEMTPAASDAPDTEQHQPSAPVPAAAPAKPKRRPPRKSPPQPSAPAEAGKDLPKAA